MFIIGISIFLAGIDLAVNQWTPIDSKCFYFSNTTTSKSDANKMCQNHGSSLYSITDQNELNSLQPFLNQNTKYWTGLTYRNNAYVWGDGRSCCSSTWWGDGEPSNNDPCVLLRIESSRWLLFDNTCDNQFAFICAKDADKTWTLVSSLSDSMAEMCGVEIMSNCDGRACKDVCELHANCDAYTQLANLCVSMKNASQTNSCVVKLRPNLEIYRLEKACIYNRDTSLSTLR